jgi:hypothetical protein
LASGIVANVVGRNALPPGRNQDPDNGYRSLSENDKAQFDVTSRPKGAEATNVRRLG